MGLDAVPRVRVEMPAPPVLGKETADSFPACVVSFSTRAESKSIGHSAFSFVGFAGIGKPLAVLGGESLNAALRQIRPTDYGSADFDHGPL